MAYSVPATHKLNRPILQGLASSSATKEHPLGYTVTSDDGTEFVYVYVESTAVETKAGRPLIWCDSTVDCVVTPDASEGDDTNSAAGSGGFAGLATMDGTDGANAYIFMQTKGLADCVLVSAVVIANDELIVSDEDCLDDVTTYVHSQTSTTYKLIGKALTGADDGTSGLHSTASVMLY